MSTGADSNPSLIEREVALASSTLDARRAERAELQDKMSRLDLEMIQLSAAIEFGERLILQYAGLATDDQMSCIAVTPLPVVPGGTKTAALPLSSRAVNGHRPGALNGRASARGTGVIVENAPGKGSVDPVERPGPQPATRSDREPDAPTWANRVARALTSDGRRRGMSLLELGAELIDPSLNVETADTARGTLRTTLFRMTKRGQVELVDKVYWPTEKIGEAMQ